MNRNDEFKQLTEELEQQIPSLEPSLSRARARKNRRRFLYAPIGSAAAVFALFVVLVNCSTTVAYACSQIPFIRDLAAAVSFSPSLSDAVDNEYVQPMNLVQEKNGVTVKVESLIVDQKQVNIFYRLDSEEYTQLEADPDVLTADGSQTEYSSFGSSSFGTENGELRHMDIDYTKGDVPDALRLILRVYSNEVKQTEAPEETTDIWADVAPEQNYIAEFDFLLQFDPKFTEVGETIPVNQTVELDGQKITFTDVELYPSHMRVNVQPDPENSAWMKGLNFYILANGKRFDPISNGITATGSTEFPDYSSYRADSAYFHDAEQLELVVTGATWLDKEKYKVRLDLETGAHDPLPRGVEFCSAKPYKNNGWIVSFRVPILEKQTMYNPFSSRYWDAGGIEYYSNSNSTFYDREGLKGDEPSTHFFYEFPLEALPSDEVWLELTSTSLWTADSSIRIPVR